MVDAALADVEARCAVLEGGVVPGDVLADVGAPRGAEAAAAAVGKPREHDVVAGLDVRDARPDLLDHARALVPEDRRQERRVDVLDDVEVRVADAARGHADRDLALFRRVELDLLDDERLVELVEDGSPHDGDPTEL